MLYLAFKARIIRLLVKDTQLDEASMAHSRGPRKFSHLSLALAVLHGSGRRQCSIATMGEPDRTRTVDKFAVVCTF